MPEELVDQVSGIGIIKGFVLETAMEVQEFEPSLPGSIFYFLDRVGMQGKSYGGTFPTFCFATL